MKNMLKGIKTAHFCVLVLLISGCGNGSDAEQKAHASANHDHEEHKESRHDDEVTLTREQMQMAGIKLGSLSSMDVQNTFKTTGEVFLPAQHRANVSVFKGGRLTAIAVNQGEPVEKGQVLGRIKDLYFIELQQKYQEALAELAFKKAQYQRKKSLYEGEVGAKEDLQEARAAYKTLQQKTNAYRSTLAMCNLEPEALKADGSVQASAPLIAPMDGIVQDVKVQIGDYIQPSNVAFSILQRRHLQLKLLIYEDQISKVDVGQKVYAQHPYEEGKLITGEIIHISNGLDGQTKAVEAYASMDSIPSKLKPGMVMDVSITTSTDSGQAMPNGGIVRHQDHNYVFYTMDDSKDTMTFMRKSMQTGPTSGDFTAVDRPTDLPENVHFVTHNAHYLLREMMEGAGGGHSH